MDDEIPVVKETSCTKDIGSDPGQGVVIYDKNYL